MIMEDTIEGKIRDYYNGQLSAIEEAEIAEWIGGNEENRARFFQIKEHLDQQKMEHLLLKSFYDELQSKLLISQQFSANVTGQFRRTPPV